jgi:hypothetical protein
VSPLRRALEWMASPAAEPLFVAVVVLWSILGAVMLVRFILEFIDHQTQEFGPCAGCGERIESDPYPVFIIDRADPAPVLYCSELCHDDEVWRRSEDAALTARGFR